MPLTPTSTLAQTFSEVLTNLAFMFVADTPPDVEGAEALLEVTIGYEGPLRGRLRMRCPPAFARLLSANLLGVDAEADADELNPHDAVKELMNVVCGQFITTVHGTEHVYQLTIPEVRELDSAGIIDSSAQGDVAELCVEGYRVQLCHSPA